MLPYKKNNSIKFSIIVPVYNAEKYLSRCLISLFNQNLSTEEYEIIAIDDGSKDHSSQILADMSQSHKNLKWTTTENRGVSEARNLGCSLASGKYLIFVDADDYIEINSLQQIYTVLEQNQLDLLVVDYHYVDNSGELPPCFQFASRYKNVSNQVIKGKDLMKIDIPQVVWSNIYRSEFWRMHDFKFLPIRHEDVEILPKIFFFAERALYFPLNFYYYYKNPDSFMMNYNSEACSYLIEAMKSVDSFRKKQVKDPLMNTCFKDIIAAELLNSIFFGINCGLSNRILQQKIKEMKDAGLCPLKHKKRGIHLLVYKFFPSLFISYYRMKIKNRT